MGFVKAAVSRRRLACSGLFAKEPGDSFVVRRDRAWPGSWFMAGSCNSSATFRLSAPASGGLKHSWWARILSIVYTGPARSSVEPAST